MTETIRSAFFRILPRLTPLLLLAAAGCAEERAPIDRVQPNALEKSFFVASLETDKDDPEFFSRQFVVDGTESESLIGISSASGVERIRWEITEDMLFARRAYSVGDGAHRGNSDKTDGSIVAAYRIESHFDIRHAYNSATGEELNVMEENTSDRPWSKREFMRVDWSQNLIESPVWPTMFFGQVFGDLKITPAVYDVSDPDAEDAPHFDPEEGYFDITSHFLVEPEAVRFGDFELPLCLWIGALTGSALYSCDPQEAIVRSSYWRVSEADPDDDYEPFENTEAPEDIFGNPGGIGTSGGVGIVTAPLEEWDEATGYTDDGLTRFVNRHNLWTQNHQTTGSCEQDADCGGGGTCLDSGVCSVPCNYKARGDANNNGTDDQCENDDTGYDGSLGSQCSARNRCTIPYRDRTIKPLAYTFNREMPAHLQDTQKKNGKRGKEGASELLLSTWNQALQVAVARAREVECRRTSSDPSAQETRATCHARFFETDGGNDKIQMVRYGGWGIETPKTMPDVLVPCHNPVREYDAEVCGKPGTVARIGDIRRHFLIYWPYVTRSPYGGIGNWRADPLTGQIIGAAATTIGRSATLAAGEVRDIIMVALGYQSLDDVLEGTSAARYERVLREGIEKAPMAPTELAKRVASVSGSQLTELSGFDLRGVTSKDPRVALAEVRDTLQTTLTQAAHAQQQVTALAAPLVGSSLELDMVDPGWLVDSLGVAPDSELTSAMVAQASPLQGQDLGNLALADQQLMRALGAQGICHLDAAASIGSPDIHGLGRYFAQKYPDLGETELAQAIYDDLWRETYMGIQLHELGHSLGLLHNFTSSYDSLNYNPQYWQLRSHDGVSTESCNGQPRTGNTASAGSDTCMGPRYLDPETDDELGQGDEPRPGINYFGHTSTMEYQNTRFFESVGLGQYDVMAMGALYGQVLQTFDPELFTEGVQQNFEPLLRTQLSEDNLVATTTGGLEGRHYTTLARDTKLISAQRCRKATSEERELGEWRIVHGKVCAPPSKDFAHWDDFVDTSEPNAPRANSTRKLRVPSASKTPGAGNVRWPYRWGADIMNSYLHVNPFDSGADQYEVTVETIKKNDFNYPFIYFRRGRREWTDQRLPSYTSRLFYERLRSYHWGTTFVNTFYQELLDQEPRFSAAIADIRNSDDELRPSLLATTEMLQAIMKTFLSPEPGEYGPNELDGAYDISGFGNDGTLFTLDASDGRFLAPAFDSTPAKGGSWEYSSFVRRGGFRFEKALAGRALTDGRPVFFSVSRDNYLDNRGIYINFRSSVPKAVDRLLGGVLGEDWATISPYVEGTAEPDVAMRDLTADKLEEALPSSYRALFPNIGYSQQLPTMVFTQLFGRLNGDMTLQNKMRVWVQGSVSGELDIPENEQIRFSDPDSGITYVARRFGTETLYGKVVDTGIASRMLARANQLLANAYEVEEDDQGQVFDEFGRPVIVRDENGAFVRREAADAYNKMRRYVGTLDAAVQVSTIFGLGPFNFF